MLFFALLCFIIWIFLNKSYKQSSYYQVTKNSYLSTLFDKGIRGEYLIYDKLSFLELDGARFLFNLYIPNTKGNTTELDVVMIAKSGIYVFESKNYSGWIFGGEDQTYWTQTLPSGKKSQKERFYNPIKQNRSHIKHLRSIIGDLVPVYSIIVFSERCELKKVSVYSSDVTVVKRYYIDRAIRAIEERYGTGHLDEGGIEKIYRQLYPYSQVSTAVKEQHISSVYSGTTTLNRQFQMQNDRENGENMLCPRCGSPLVRRTARKGSHKGEKFYGCSSYPNCRFIKDL